MVSCVVPERNREIHPHYRSGSSRRRPLARWAHARELFARRRDGSEFPVEIGLNRVLSSVVDITERMRAEQERTDLLVRERAAREEAEGEPHEG